MSDNEHAQDKPSKIAVALRYQLGVGLPRVVALGKGHLAERIVERAVDASVPIERNDAVAGALAELEIDQAIPPELFRAVAEVIGFLLRRGALPQQSVSPCDP